MRGWGMEMGWTLSEEGVVGVVGVRGGSLEGICLIVEMCGLKLRGLKPGVASLGGSRAEGASSQDVRYGDNF